MSRYRSRLFRLLAAALAASALAVVPVVTTPAAAATGCPPRTTPPKFPNPTDPAPEAPVPPQMTMEEIKAYVAGHHSANGVKGDPHVYISAQGHPTVGVGFNLDRPDAPALLAAVGADYNAVRNGTQNLTSFQIITLFEADFNAAITTLEQIFPDLWYTLLPNRRAVLIDMMYTMGTTDFSYATLFIAAVRAETWPLANQALFKTDYAAQFKTQASENAEILRDGANCKAPASVPAHSSTGGGNGSTAYGDGTLVSLPGVPGSSGGSSGGGGGIRSYQGITLCSIQTFSVYYEGHWVSTTIIDCGP
ncbi:hypothetical protein [Streptomyces lushanensis]|uniref:hypothetical protein n=1 Tax=Streptomyces lushanensis TaxID=1434255 RepID=UPI00082A7D8F|nr:hypothetical protein [Streptomyces lushanensis]